MQTRTVIMVSLIITICSCSKGEPVTADEMMKRISWVSIAGFLIESGGKTIYIDPARTTAGDLPVADLILYTHTHTDHLDINGLKNIADKKTIIAGPHDVAVLLNHSYRVIEMTPESVKKIKGVKVETTIAYNPQHPKDNSMYSGFIITVDGVRIYHIGPTDMIPEMSNYRCDILLGYIVDSSMDYTYLAKTAIATGARFAVPMHVQPSRISAELMDKQNQILGDRCEAVKMELRK